MTLPPLMTTSPAAPTGRNEPSGPMVATCWPGRAGPTVPALRTPSIGLQVDAQVPSVRPYPSTIGKPNRDSLRSSSSLDTGAAPHTANRTDEVSRSSSSGSSASRA